MIILAHRGWWDLPEERNSRAAFRRAFEAGYGAEIDVRDRDGILVVSHDPPVGETLRLEQVLEDYALCGAPARLAVNIKADGLCPWIAALLARWELTEKAFVFDASVPDMRAYLEAEVPVFTRFSEVEAVPAFYAGCEGVWVDSFEPAGASIDRAISDLRRGKAAALVSPELHRRPHADAWETWSDALRRAGPMPGRAMICTDHPHLAERRFAWMQQEAAA